jgi:hypothetical protein
MSLIAASCPTCSNCAKYQSTRISDAFDFDHYVTSTTSVSITSSVTALSPLNFTMRLMDQGCNATDGLMPEYGLWQMQQFSQGFAMSMPCHGEIIGRLGCGGRRAQERSARRRRHGSGGTGTWRRETGKLLLSSETTSTRERALASATPSPGLSPYAFGRKTDP